MFDANHLLKIYRRSPRGQQFISRIHQTSDFQLAGTQGTAPYACMPYGGVCNLLALDVEERAAYRGAGVDIMMSPCIDQEPSSCIARTPAYAFIWRPYVFKVYKM